MEKSSIEKLHEESSDLMHKHLKGELSARDLIVMQHNLYYEAKQMHKQDIIEAYEEGQNTTYEYSEDNDVNYYDGRNYYKNTYEKEN